MKNYKRSLFELAVLAVGFLTVSSADAVEYNINLGYGSARNTGSSGNGAYGGEFLVTGANAAGVTWATSVAANYAASARNAAGTGFETFCIEYNEHFSPGSSYWVSPSPNAIKGGPPDYAGDAISAGTGYLYNLFARGQLTGYNNDAATAGALQQTLWFLEGEQGSSGGLFDGLLITAFGTLANAQLTNATFFGGASVNAASFGVAALNMGTSSDGNGGAWPNQDQLVYQGGGLQVPDGGTTLMLLGMALGGLSLLKRKFA